MPKRRESRRSGEAVAAQHRKAGPMKHRLTPRGGAKAPIQYIRCEGCEDDEPLSYDPVTSLSYHTNKDPVSGRRFLVVCPNTAR